MAKHEKINCDGCGEEAPSYIETFVVLEGRRLGFGDTWHFCSCECLSTVVNRKSSHFETQAGAIQRRDERANKIIDVKNYEMVTPEEMRRRVTEHAK